MHMSAAKDALLALYADIICLQGVRDWESVKNNSRDLREAELGGNSGRSRLNC